MASCRRASDERSGPTSSELATPPEYRQNSPSRLPSALGTVEGHYRNGGALRVAVLGTGIMGSAMVRNLVAAGLHTTVWDRTQSAKAPLIEAGVSVGAPRRCAVPRW